MREGFLDLQRAIQPPDPPDPRQPPLGSELLDGVPITYQCRALEVPFQTYQRCPRNPVEETTANRRSSEVNTQIYHPVVTYRRRVGGPGTVR